MVGTMGALTAAGAKATVQGALLFLQAEDISHRWEWDLGQKLHPNS